MSAEDRTLFGDYSLDRIRGRFVGDCFHCKYVGKPRGHIGHAEQAVREHIMDAHRIYRIRRDFRQAWGTR